MDRSWCPRPTLQFQHTRRRIIFRVEQGNEQISDGSGAKKLHVRRALDERLLAVRECEPDVYTSISAAASPLTAVAQLLKVPRNLWLKSPGMQTIPPAP